MRKVTIVTMRKVTIVTMRKVTIVSFFLLQIGLLDLKQRRSLGFLILKNKQTSKEYLDYSFFIFGGLRFKPGAGCIKMQLTLTIVNINHLINFLNYF